MKKYPFSKKAVKAMLVAALALTPAASFGGVQVAAAENEPQVSVAATYSSVDQLITRLDTVYDQLTDQQRGYLTTARDNLNSSTLFPANSWANYASKISQAADDELTDTDPETVLLKKLVELTTFSSDVETLKTNIATFKSEQQDNIDTVLGENITVDKVLNFIADVESKYIESLRGMSLDNVNETSLVLQFALAMNTVSNDTTSDNYTSNNEVYQALDTALDISAVPGVLAEISNKIDPSPYNARKAFISALQKVQPSTGGGGGGAVIPPVEQPAPGEVALPQGSTETVKQGSAVVTQVPASKVAEIVTQITAEKAVIPLTLEAPAAGETAKAQLPAALFTQAAEKNANAVVNVKTEEASYQLPVNEINVAALANELGVAAADVKIEISVNVVPQSEVKADLDNNKLNAVSDVIEFTVKAVSGDKELAVSKFSTYVKRTIVGNKTFNPDRTAAVKLVNGKFQAAPATFKGKEATIFKKDNSKYVIVENDKTFSDVNNGKNFAEASIEKLASKYIIFGKSDTEYANSLAITRGEFAALISRSLGLTAQNPTQLKFTDTPSTKAVNQNGEINAAAEAGIVSGYAGNIFKPDQPINRAEAAIMLSKALDYVKVASSEYNTSKKLADFKDDTVIGTTSRQYVEKVYQAGLMSGFSDKSFGPDKSMQRDQMAVVLDKLLQAAELID